MRTKLKTLCNSAKFVRISVKHPLSHNLRISWRRFERPLMNWTCDGFVPVLMIEILNNLSYERIEYLINDRLSFMRFRGLELWNRVPDAKRFGCFASV